MIRDLPMRAAPVSQREAFIPRPAAITRWGDSIERTPPHLTQDRELLSRVAETSNQVVDLLVDLSAARPDLALALEGKLLDVGVGDGGLVLAAAARCPLLKIVGLEIWEPAFAFARAKAAASPHGRRIQIRMQDVTQIDERNAYSLIWLPAPYLLPRAAPTAFDRLTLALKPGGLLIVGNHVPSEGGPSSQEVLRSSNQAWRSEDLAAHMRARSYLDQETLAGPTGVELLIGRRP